MGVKMNLSTITSTHAADPQIGFLTKSILKSYGRATAMPPAWELNNFKLTLMKTICSPVLESFTSRSCRGCETFKLESCFLIAHPVRAFMVSNFNISS